MPYDSDAMSCSSCSQPLPAGARFCPSCGQAVELTNDEERKVVTVLFADVAGFTALAEHLDPERVKRLIDGTLERLVAAVRRYGGTVDKVLGDGLLALFGVPAAHEDDPTRALCAAIEMHASILAMNSEGEELPVEVQLRVGVNTGEVLVGVLRGTDDYTAMGDVVNVTHRLQGLAPPGDVYVGDATARLAGDEVILEVIDDVEVRGREQTERIWRAVGRRANPVAVPAHKERQFVGRATQQALLNSLLDGITAGRSAVVALTGEAGSGKTRLVNEVLGSREAREFSEFAGVCAPFGEETAWTPIAGALLRRMGLDRTAAESTMRERVRERGVALYRFDPGDVRLDRWVEGALHLMGYPSELDRLPPAEVRERLFGLVVEAVRRRSLERPVVLWIDDLQWADPLLIDLLNRLARSVADRPVLIITAQRDESDVDWPPSADLPLTVRMPLDPLEVGEAEELVQTVFGGSASDELVEQIYERGGGNPLFLLQLAELASDAPDSTELPGSLRALISARVDRLDPGPRAILDNAAVLGGTGPVASLAAFAAHLGQQFSADDLDTLEDFGLLEIDDGWWQFRSDVVREVVYQTLTKTARAQRHAGTASVMIGRRSVGIDQIAHHAATAAELVGEIGPVPGVSPQINEQSVALLLEAVQKSLDSGAFANARRLATRALDLSPSDPGDMRNLLLMRSEAAAERRDLPAARSDAQRALDSSLRAGDLTDQAIALRLLGVIAQTEGDIPLARAEIERSIELLRVAGNTTELGTSLSDAGFVEVFGGSLGKADELLTEAETLFIEIGDRRRRAWAVQHKAWVAFLSGDVSLARQRIEETLAVFEELGDEAGVSWCLGLMAYLHFMEGDLERATALAMRVRELSLEDGQSWAPAMMDTLLSAIRLWSGDFAGSNELSRRALVTFRETGDRFGIIFALAPRMRSLVALGRGDEAQVAMEEALALSESFGDLAYPAIAVAGAAAHLGLGERALELGERALRRSSAVGADDSEVRITLALLLCQAGRAEEALAELLEVAVESPYFHAVHALASVLTGDAAMAVKDADAVAAAKGASYLDRILAELAAGVALWRDGDASGAHTRLAAARDTALTVGDSVAHSLVANVDAATTGPSLHPSEVDLAPGWRNVVRSLA